MKSALSVICATLLATGCATGMSAGNRQAAKLELYQQHAGPPVASFRYLGSITRWTPLGDSALAVWTSPSRAWLLELSAPCSDVEYAQSISITANGGTVSARFDKVIARAPGVRPMPCVIEAIRPLDVKSLKQAQAAARD